MQSDTFRMRGQVTIKLIDRETGRELHSESHRNDIAIDFPSAIANMLIGAAPPHLGPIKQCLLYGSAGNLIKTLDETYRTVLEATAEGANIKVHVTFRDSTTDAYTVAGVTLRMVDASGKVSEVVYKAGLNVSKTSDKVLVVDWSIYLPFTI